MSGEDSIDLGVDADVDVGRGRRPIETIFVLTGRLVPSRSGAESDAADPESITSPIIDEGGAALEYTRDIVAARFDRASSVLAAAARLGGRDDATGARSSRCWAVHAVADRRRGDLDVSDALRRASAISGIGHPGQVLISDPARRALDGEDVVSDNAVDLGVHRLGALPRSERIWQLGRIGRQFPPLRSANTFQKDLPSRLTPLIARDDEIVGICGLLADERFVTLTGPGGVGKTSLALACAAESAANFDRICVIELADVIEPHGVPGAFLDAAGVWPDVEHPLASLVDSFDGERVLLVVDNCEHLATSVADLLSGLLAHAPGIVVIGTSRRPIGLTGEVTYRVPPLACPPEPGQRSTSTHAMHGYGAVQLFVDRAVRADPTFSLDDHTAPMVGSLCRYLDGIPLAIELVAPLVRHAQLEQIADTSTFPSVLHNAGGTGRPARHESIASSIDWSLGQLNVFEGELIRVVGVFTGPTPLAAVVHIVRTPERTESVSFETLGALCDKNLLHREHGPSGPDYLMLNLVRERARQRAMDAGDLGRLEEAHADWWTRWLEPRATAQAADDLAAIDRYYSNLLAAMRRIVDRPLLALRLLTNMAEASQNLGRSRDIVAFAPRVLTDEIAERHPTEWLAAATATSLRYDLAGTHGELRAFVRRIRDVALRHHDEYSLAITDFQLGDSRAHCEAMERAARERGDRWIAALARTLAAQYEANIDPNAALESLEVAANLEGADRLITSIQLRIRGRIARDLGRFDHAVEYANRLVATRSELTIENGVHLMSQIALLSGDGDLAKEALAVAVSALQGPYAEAASRRLAHVVALINGFEQSEVDDLLIDDRPATVGTLWLLCAEAVDAGQADLALRRLGEHAPQDPYAVAVTAVIRASALDDIGAAHEALRIAAGSGHQLVAIDAMELLVVDAHRSGRTSDAARLLGAAEHARRAIGYTWRFKQVRDNLEGVRLAILHGGDDAAPAELVAGSALSLEEAAEYAGRARGERSRPRHGWDALTPAEHKVIDLVADGLTNRQVAERLLMSRSTVKTHLEHIFTKVGLHNRTELAAEYVRRNLDTP